MSNIAAIDIGSNSIRLLISSLKDGKYITLVRDIITTRLGKNIETEKLINKENSVKTIEAIIRYLNICSQFKVSKIRAVGTSVLRRAKNSIDFLQEVYNKTGLNIEIISGEDEARLSFEGVVKSLDINSEKIMVADIGGGSSELIFGDLNCAIEVIKSIDIGSVTLSEKFVQDDPPDPKKIKIMNEYALEKIRKELQIVESYRQYLLIGVAGTVSTLGSIFLKMDKYERDRLNGLKLNKEEIKNIFKRLCSVSLEERKKIKGLQEERADIIIGGISILLAIMDYFSKEKLMISEHDILDGIIYSL